jgi:hypothetical protein
MQTTVVLACFDERDERERKSANLHASDVWEFRRAGTKLAPETISLRKIRDLVAERTGLEPATPGVTGRYSNQLNYRSDECESGCSEGAASRGGAS